jgi:hypothetical protein
LTRDPRKSSEPTLSDLEAPSNPEAPDDAEGPARPPSCEDLPKKAQERPKPLRLLPRITVDAVRLVWAASPRMLVASIGLKLVNGAGLAVALVFGRNLIGSVLATSGTTPGIGAVAPQLVAGSGSGSRSPGRSSAMRR